MRSTCVPPIYVQYVRVAYKLCLIHSVSRDGLTNNIDEFCAILSKFLSSNFISVKSERESKICIGNFSSEMKYLPHEFFQHSFGIKHRVHKYKTSRIIVYLLRSNLLHYT